MLAQASLPGDDPISISTSLIQVAPSTPTSFIPAHSLAVFRLVPAPIFVESARGNISFCHSEPPPLTQSGDHAAESTDIAGRIRNMRQAVGCSAEDLQITKGRTF
jgi:hypothetical protein